MAKNFKVNGTVKYAGKNNDGKNVVTLLLTPERAEELTRALELDSRKYESIPIKTLEETNELLFKCASTFSVRIYDNGDAETDLKLSDIGEGSEVSLFIGIDVTKYKNKEYQVAYLKSINVLKLEEATHFNPFDSDDVTTV